MRIDIILNTQQQFKSFSTHSNIIKSCGISSEEKLIMQGNNG